MFKVKGKADDLFLILTPNWRDNVQSILSYEGIAIKEDEEYFWIILGNVNSSTCKQWSQDESTFKEFPVQGRNCVLKLLRKEIELYGKRLTPTPWDEVLADEFKDLLDTYKGQVKGVLNCSDAQFKYVTKFYREKDPGQQEAYRSEFLSVERLENVVVLPDFEIPSQNNKNWGGGTGKRETTEERLETRLTWYRQSLSKFLFDDDDTYDLRSCFERAEKVKGSASNFITLLNHIVSN